jgi:hypothetical protein
MIREVATGDREGDHKVAEAIDALVAAASYERNRFL